MSQNSPQQPNTGTAWSDPAAIAHFGGNSEYAVGAGVPAPPSAPVSGPAVPHQAHEPRDADPSERVARLLESLVHSTPLPAGPLAVATLARGEHGESVFALARLGLAGSLYNALRCKHPPTAAHSLRVARTCAAWTRVRELPPEESDRIELAALLHDLGKLGVPDRILRNPGKLTVEEQATVSLAPTLGCEILRGCCGDEELLEIIRHCGAWYAGRPDQALCGDRLPLGSRMVAIADAYDSMTTDQTYRPAMPRDHAVGNLFSGSGVQFDPELTREFCELLITGNDWPSPTTQLRSVRVDAHAADWLPWAGPTPTADAVGSGWNGAKANPFFAHLLGSLSDGVIFVDSDRIIRGWNDAAVRLTGIAADAALDHDWSPSLLTLLREETAGELIPADCPVARALSSGGDAAGRFQLRRGDGSSIPIHLRVVPATAAEAGLAGVVVIIRDLSKQSRLEERVETLCRQVIQDPLTGVANRAEMDRRLDELTDQSIRSAGTFSLVICDIDHFKRINDVHGHQAGDEALVRVAEILTAQSREEDLVCRYGGEEFVILCPDCDLVVAARRAEAIRTAVERTKLSMLGDQSVTACFGVTQFQAGDTAESVLGRADRALLQAKDNGRNQVVQLGVGGLFAQEEKATGRGWLDWLRPTPSRSRLKATITTPVPTEMVIQKLRGFIADHHAEILSVSEGELKLKLNVSYTGSGRRGRETTVPFCVQMRLSQDRHRVGVGGSERMTTQNRTIAAIDLTPLRATARRNQEIAQCARRILMGINGYLMGDLKMR